MLLFLFALFSFCETLKPVLIRPKVLKFTMSCLFFFTGLPMPTFSPGIPPPTFGNYANALLRFKCDREHEESKLDFHSLTIGS